MAAEREITDPALYQDGIEALDRAADCKFLSIDHDGLAATIKFLELTDLSAVEHGDVVASIDMNLRIILLLSDLTEWYRTQATEAQAAGDPQTATELHRQCLRMYDQFSVETQIATMRLVVWAFEFETIKQLIDLANDDSELLRREEAAQLETRANDKIVQSLVVDRARVILDKNAPWKTVALPLFGETNPGVLYIVHGGMAAAVIALSVCGFLFLGIGRWRAEASPATPGLVVHLLLVGIAFAATATVFGAAPARMLDQRIQVIAVTVMKWLTPTTFVMWASWLSLKRRGFRFSLRATLILVLVCALFFALLAINVRKDRDFLSLSDDWPIPAAKWHELDPYGVRLLIYPVENTSFAVLQWVAWGGHLWMILLWIVLAAAYLAAKRKWTRPATAQGARPSCQHVVGLSCRSFVRPAFALAALLLALHLSLSPYILRKVEHVYQDQMARANNPHIEVNKLQTAISVVLEDEAQMGEIQQDAIKHAAELQGDNSK